MTVKDRLEADEENSLDRRKIGNESKKKLAELIQYGETESALRYAFEVLTGETVNAYPPTRTVELPISIPNSFSKRIECRVGFGKKEKTVLLSDSRTVSFSDVESGLYEVSIEPLNIVEYTDELEIENEFEIMNFDVATYTDVDLDVSDKKFGERVSIDELTITAIEVGKIQ